MEELIGINMIFFAVTLFVVMTIGCDMETKEKATILLVELICVGLFSGGVFLMEG